MLCTKQVNSLSTSPPVVLFSPQKKREDRPAGKQDISSTLVAKPPFFRRSKSGKKSLCLASKRRSERAIVESFSFTRDSSSFNRERNLEKSLSKLYIHQSGRHGKEPWVETDGGIRSPVRSYLSVVKDLFPTSQSKTDGQTI